MFERFTDRARRVVVLAQEEARLLNHNYIGTEHILLGLIHEGEGVAAKALESLGISLEAVRSQVEEIIGQGGSSPSGHIPFTPRAKKVLELSLREALQLGHNYIGTEHILLGLIHEGEGVAAKALESLGISLEAVRGQVEEMIGRGGSPLNGYIPFTPRAKKVLELSLREALQLGHNYIDTEHILLGLIREGEGVAAQILVKLGAEPPKVREQITQILSGGGSGSGPGSGEKAGPADDQLLEGQFEQWLVDNWDQVDFGAPLRLYEEDGQPVGRQYDTGVVGRIDLLCEDASSGALVVMGLSRGEQSDDIVTQLVRHMGWVRENLADGRAVEGVVLTPALDERLRYAAMSVPNVRLLRYETRFEIAPL